MEAGAAQACLQLSCTLHSHEDSNGGVAIVDEKFDVKLWGKKMPRIQNNSKVYLHHVHFNKSLIYGCGCTIVLHVLSLGRVSMWRTRFKLWPFLRPLRCASELISVISFADLQVKSHSAQCHSCMWWIDKRTVGFVVVVLLGDIFRARWYTFLALNEEVTSHLSHGQVSKMSWSESLHHTKAI